MFKHRKDLYISESFLCILYMQSKNLETCYEYTFVVYILNIDVTDLMVKLYLSLPLKYRNSKTCFLFYFSFVWGGGGVQRLNSIIFVVL